MRRRSSSSALEQDQAAREAVAAAVELAGAIAQLPADHGRVLAGPRWSPERTWPRWVAAAAAGLLLVLALKVYWFPFGGEPDARALGASSLALAWSGVHHGEDESDNLLQWLDGPPQSADTPQLAVVDASDASEAGVPDWMLEAASLNGDSSPDLSPRKEN